MKRAEKRVQAELFLRALKKKQLSVDSVNAGVEMFAKRVRKHRLRYAFNRLAAEVAHQREAESKK